jgi:hypothetical protein
MTNAIVNAGGFFASDAVERLAASDLFTSEELSEKFDAIGYELVAEYSRDNENLENEERDALKAIDIKEPCDYSFGYASGVKITVKRKADEDEEAPAEEPSFEGLSEEEAELAENERILEEARKEAARDVAFTSMYFVHIYKAFWRESVSISDGTDEIKNDLNEFLSVLTEKGAEAEAEAE